MSQTERERFAEAAKEATEELADLRDRVAWWPEASATIQKALMIVGSCALWTGCPEAFDPDRRL